MQQATACHSGVFIVQVFRKSVLLSILPEQWAIASSQPSKHSS
ncbi:MAG: hypothetical protein NW224_17005 [Leptolyngbyaceae cyanobacterium bins.302]|nr:hypothetical protein [Leptolyngbyaceae cyanobacterium bins.302]